MCIIQDNIDDKNRELQLMGEIYKNSKVTIVAGSSWTANEGFLQPRKSPESQLRLPAIGADGVSGVVTLTPRHPYPQNSYLRENPIEHRAWTFQERMLSPRLLIFSNTNMRWLCKCWSAYDGGSEDMLGTHDAGMGTLTAVGNWDQKWRSIVYEYSRRKISFSDDKFPAISAIAQERGKETNDEYLAGLWKSTLPKDLLWIIHSWSNRANRPKSYRAPSWSWASVDEPVGWVYDGDFEGFEVDSSFEVIRYEPSFESSDMIFGKLTQAALCLRCCVAQLGSRDEVVKYAGEKEKPEYSIRFDDENENDADSGPIFGLRVGWIARDVLSVRIPVGLLIKPCRDTVGKYTRVGIFHNTNYHTIGEREFEGSTVREICLI